MPVPKSLEQIRRLPKIDLHRHLEGSLRTETLWEFHRAQRQNRFASLSDLKAACTIAPGATPGFANFLSCIDAQRFKFGGMDALSRVATEAVADAAADNIVHLELRFSPVFFARRTYDAAPAQLFQPDSPELIEQSAQTIVAAARREAKRHGMSVAFVLTTARHLGIAVNRPALELLRQPVGAEFCGLDLAGDENVPALDFLPFLAQWREAGRGITIHAGEARPGPGAAGVRAAFEKLSADRIGHGVRGAEDDAVLELLARERIPLEVCLTSNVQTQASPSYAGHQLRRLLAADARVTLNTDDPAVSGITLSDEFYFAQTQCGVNWPELSSLAAAAALAAFLPLPERQSLAQRIAAAWAAD